MRSLPLLITPLLLFACSPSSDDDIRNTGDTASLFEAADFIYEVNVYPTRDADDLNALLPQSYSVPAGAAVGVALTMNRPVVLSGSVQGYLVTPRRDATLPGQDVQVDAEVSVLLEDTIQSRYTATNEAGEFSVSLVPGSTYSVVIRPNTASLPYLVESIDIEQDVALELNLGAGVALWGQVVDPLGLPIVGAEVAARDLLGTVGVSTLTDDEGQYLLRVQEGTYSGTARIGPWCR